MHKFWIDLKISFMLALILVVGLGFSSFVKAEELTVSAAASLTNAFKDLFSKEHPNLKVFVNFAASNPLLKQMQEGAPVDVFASADEETMDKADASKVIDPKTRKVFARNSLVLIVPASQKKVSLKDLPKMKRIAIGNPQSVPAGRYAKQALTHAKLWDELQAKFILGNSVRQVLDYVVRGEVDCGVVYATDAYQQKTKVEICETLSGHKPILYPIALATTGKNAKAGQDFLNFVLSDPGSAVLKKYGFQKP